MLLIRLLLFISLAISCVGCADSHSRKPESREKLETLITEGIQLLEAKNYKGFIELYLLPAELKKHTKGISLEEFAKRFGEQEAPHLIECLKEIKGTKPSLEDNGTKATFAWKPQKGGVVWITFVKVDKYWYIAN